jgi:N-acetylneuraminic acid mutarotase
MKLYPFILLLFLLSSCALKVDQNDARSVAESLLTDLKNENYADLDKYFTDLSNAGQSQENKEERYRRLKDTTGPIKSYEFLEAKEEYDSQQHLNQLTLKYKVVCGKATVLQTFLFINDAGESKIIFQNIENME